jgi:hypothetical protein
MTDDGPLTTDGLRVCARRCETCIFRRGNLMHLHAARVPDMVADALAADTAIVCHKTLDGERAVCRGFWDRHRRDTLMCRLGAGIYGVLETEPDG